MTEVKKKGTVRNASEKQLKDLKFVKDLQIYVYAVKWNQKRLTLKEFADTFQEPQLIKIVRGQYNTLGYPTRANPMLNPLMFVWGKRVRVNIIAQCIKYIKYTKKRCVVGSRFEITDDYDGFFEVMSENGESLIHINSVSELSHHYSKNFMVMKRIHAHLRGLDVGQQPTLGDVRTLKIGEVITVGVILRPGNTDITPPCGCRRLLECETLEGERVLLSMEDAGRFSEMGEDIGLTGAQTVTTLLTKRFPMNVKLTEGDPLPSGGDLSPHLRLMSKEREEVLTVLPLCKDAREVHVPTSVALEVRVPANLEELSRMAMHGCLMHWIDGLLQEKTETRNDQESQPPESEQTSDADLPQPNTSGPSDTLNEARGDSSPDPYDEIDRVYAEMRRIAAERGHIPVEKETTL